MAVLDLAQGRVLSAPSSSRGGSERELIVRAQRYEADALADLFEEHFDALHRYVSRLVADEGRIEDALRAILTRALQGLPRFHRFESGFEVWLYRVANAVLSDRERFPVPPPGESEEDRFRAAILGLTADQFDVVALRFVAGLPTATVARATGRRVGQVQALQHRALLALRRELA